MLQEKIKRIQQIRMEKELRAQQILEVRPAFNGKYKEGLLQEFNNFVLRLYALAEISVRRLKCGSQAVNFYF